MAGYSTTDHIFVLQSLIELLIVKKMKLFCFFVDFSKAFDSVWRVVSFNGEQSFFFQSYRGVRQGENLSPILFTIFLNVLMSCWESNNASGVNLELKFDELTLFLKLFILLYAGNTVIFGTDEKQFQDNLNLFFEYTKIWKLDVNFVKTKVMIKLKSWFSEW